MNIQTNFNKDTARKLKSLVGTKLKELIFFADNMGANRFSASFPSRNKNLFFTGSRLALAFKVPSLNKDKRILEVLSLKCSNFEKESYIIDAQWGERIWNIDFHFDTIIGDRRIGIVVRKIEEVELYSKKHKKLVNSSTHFSISNQSVSKIEVFGMKEYFEDINKVDFENMRYLNKGAFEEYSYPIDINIVTFILITLSEGMCLLISVSYKSIRVIFGDGSEDAEKMYESIKSRKNAFNRPFAKLLYTTES